MRPVFLTLMSHAETVQSARCMLSPELTPDHLVEVLYAQPEARAAIAISDEKRQMVRMVGAREGGVLPVRYRRVFPCLYWRKIHPNRFTVGLDPLKGLSRAIGRLP